MVPDDHLASLTLLVSPLKAVRLLYAIPPVNFINKLGYHVSISLLPNEQTDLPLSCLITAIVYIACSLSIYHASFFLKAVCVTASKIDFTDSYDWSSSAPSM